MSKPDIVIIGTGGVGKTVLMAQTIKVIVVDEKRDIFAPEPTKIKNIPLAQIVQVEKSGKESRRERRKYERKWKR